jgi:hypothetical protein
VENNAYMNILIDTLTKKITELDKIIQKTVLQEKYLSDSPFNMDCFMKTVAEKQIFIEKLNQLDNGFDKVYDHIKEDIKIKNPQNREKIVILQDLVKQIMEKNAKILSMEMSNKVKLEVYSINKKKEIKEFKVSRRTAAAYYKNMPDQHYGQSCFFNKKK